MKRYIAHAALLTCMVGTVLSCGRNGVSEPEPEVRHTAIGFNTDLTQTRNFVQDAGRIVSLGIFGYSGNEGYTGTAGEEPNVFENQSVARADASSDWIYSPLAYWPLDQSIKNTFYAYSPYTPEQDDSNGSNFYVYNDNGTPYICYSPPENVSEHVDVLYSDLNSDVKDISYSFTADISNGLKAGEVKYDMNHSLVWIRFLLAADREIIGYTDNDPVSGTPIYEDATAFYIVREFGFFGSDIVTGGTLNMRTGEWDDLERGVAEYEFDGLMDRPDGGVKLTVGTVGTLTSADENSLMIFPQDINYTRDGTTVWFTFTYYPDDSATPDFDTDTEYYITLPFPDVKLTSAGYVMTYIVKLSRSGSYIEFHSQNTIEEWLEDNTLREIPVQ